jgi:Uma2 family endonuclease
VQTTEPTELRRFSAAEVTRMVEEGILRDDEPVELLDGELVVTPPQGPSPAAVVSDLDGRLREIYPERCHVRAQCPLGGAADSLPEPDLAVVRGKPRDYVAAHPRGADVVLVVEVAHTSQAIDRRKVRSYARIGVPFSGCSTWRRAGSRFGRSRTETSTGPLAFFARMRARRCPR